MIKVKILIVLLTGLCFCSKAQDCELKKDKDGIKVYLCSQDTSKFTSIKAEFTIKNTSPKAFLRLMMDVDNYDDWQYSMDEVKLIKAIDAYSFIYYTVLDFPWPLSNREMMMKFQATIDPQNKILDISMRNIPYDYERNSKYTEMGLSDAKWHAVQQPDNTLQINYSLRLDPGGSVSPWLVNMAMAEGPYLTFRKIKTLLEERSN